jgi:two-component system cell cycle sensor histidine kinase/response regulator CckA
MNSSVDSVKLAVSPKPDAGRSFTTWAGLVLLLGIVIAGVAWSFLYWDEMTSGLRVLIVGASTMAALLFVGLLIIIRSGEQADRRSARRDAVYANAFFETVRPQLITTGVDHQPIHANRAYRDVARKLDVEIVGEAPPSVDRLFQTNQPEGSTAIFRLHNMHAETLRASEELDLILPDGTPSRFRITVSRLSPDRSELLWQVDEIASEDDAAAMLARAPIGLFSATQDGRILSVNDRLESWLGGPDALSRAHISEFLEEPDILIGSEAAHGKTVRSDTRIITRKGVVTPAVLIARWNATDTGELVASVALHGHAAKPVSPIVAPAPIGAPGPAHLSAKASAAPIPFGVLQIEGTSFADATVRYANRAFANMSGLDDVTGLPFVDLFDGSIGLPLAGKTFAEIVQTDPIDVTLNGKEPLPVALYIAAEPQQADRVTAYLVDVSARRSLENQLRQSQKLQAIGQLAAGVAHDFNNLLTAIRLNTDELLQRHPVGDPSYPELQSINATGARAAALVKKLLAFSRQQTRRAERLDVSEALSDMYLTLKQTLGGQAQLELSHARDLPRVLADKSQFDNVIMNLCVNARDAMEAQGGGTISIVSERVDRNAIEDTALLTAFEAFPTDDIVRISVSDTGTGMTEAVQAKIFEPFFTTKDQGKGTGLGLATVYGVIQQSGGHLSVDSILGEGTTFNIYLPAAPELGAEEQAVAAEAVQNVERKPADLAGQGNILFVEDEASVRVIAAKSLRKRGYTVVEAEDGEEALEILEDAETPFDMLLSDVVMPGLDGPGLLRAGRQYLGDARIVFISGYAAEKFSDLLAEEPDVTFLPKPFTLAELAEKVKMEIGEAAL